MKTSCIPLNLNFLGEMAFLEGIFCFEYPNIHISQTTDFHFVSFHFVSFHFVLQTTVSQREIPASGPHSDIPAVMAFLLSATLHNYFSNILVYRTVETFCAELERMVMASR